MIPALLTQRYELILALDKARALRHALRAGGIEGQELQFITETIKNMEAELSETECEAQELIDLLDDMQARLFAALHYQAGYQWSEIAGIFGLTEDAAKACVYRALRRVCGGDTTR